MSNSIATANVFACGMNCRKPGNRTDDKTVAYRLPHAVVMEIEDRLKV
ncbi:hypothetical protein L6Q21_08765 [Sandaracinobacter sp. RS1-74]|nr:hypothetical protein [Sandaracinobacteroides sayramensis]MCG2841070.1 hypothetical protein [Sandaracinobacteroides sayramensis]